ncbi:MAG: hypothetical protein AB1696_15875 [Planctomycetota bacterium]
MLLQAKGKMKRYRIFFILGCFCLLATIFCGCQRRGPSKGVKKQETGAANRSLDDAKNNRRKAEKIHERKPPTREFLLANGFTKENGAFVRRDVMIKELRDLFGFALADLDPGINASDSHNLMKVSLGEGAHLTLKVLIPGTRGPLKVQHIKTPSFEGAQILSTECADDDVVDASVYLNAAGTGHSSPKGNLREKERGTPESNKPQ